MTRQFRPPVDPSATVADPVRWGILAPTSMVARLAVLPALEASPQSSIVATASQSAGDDYASVVEHPDVEVVYVPLPNGLHRDWVERCAAAGKHVLCEKPLAISGADARAMAAACAKADVVLAEAYATPFHPRTVAMLDVVAQGRLGRIVTVDATFTFPLVADDATNHRLDADLGGGGALADVGVYVTTPIFEIAALTGQPDPLSLTTHGSDVGGVDATTTGTVHFPGGMTGRFTASFEAPEAQRLEIVGTEARLRIDHAFTPDASDSELVLEGRDGSIERITGLGGNASRAMVDHVAAVVRGRATLRRPPAMGAAFADLCDRIRSERSPA